MASSSAAVDRDHRGGSGQQQHYAGPSVECRVRSRIPTGSRLCGGVVCAEFDLLLYAESRQLSPRVITSVTTTAHCLQPMAFVFGASRWRHSTSLEMERVPAETPHQRFVRGCLTRSAHSDVIPAAGQPTLPCHHRRRHSHEATATAAGEDSSLPPLVRVHSACFTGETVYSARCDCGDQLRRAMQLMSQSGDGVIIYLPQEGRGIGLEAKLMAYNLQDAGHDTVDANRLLKHPVDGRQYAVAAEILRDLNIEMCRLLTNNPDKITQLRQSGIDVVERVALLGTAADHIIPSPLLVSTDTESTLAGRQMMAPSPPPNSGVDPKVDAEIDADLVAVRRALGNRGLFDYLRTKVARMGHMIELDGNSDASSQVM